MAKQEYGAKKIVPMKKKPKPPKPGIDKTNPKIDGGKNTIDKSNPKIKGGKNTIVPLSARPGSFKMIPAKGAENQNPARPAKTPPKIGKPGVGRKTVTSAGATKRPMTSPVKPTKSMGKPAGPIKSTNVRRPQGR